MLELKNIMKPALVASLLALPMSANALTITGDDTVINTSFIKVASDGSPSNVVLPAATLSLGSGEEYLMQFFAQDTGAGFAVTQDFTNDTGIDVVFAASGRNIDPDFAGFALEAIVGATTYSLGINGDLFTVAAGGTFTIRASGDATSSGNFDLTVAAVPVPAAGLMLLTALGGLGFARRKKKSA